MSEIDAIPEELLAIGLRCWVEALADGTPDAGKIIARALLAERLTQRELDAKIADSYAGQPYRVPTHPDAADIAAAIRNPPKEQETP